MLPQDPTTTSDITQDQTPNMPEETQASGAEPSFPSQPEPSSFPAEVAPTEGQVTFEQPAPVEPEATSSNGEMPQ